jgi:hypothetical protein
MNHKLIDVKEKNLISGGFSLRKDRLAFFMQSNILSKDLQIDLKIQCVNGEKVQDSIENEH